MRRKYFLRGMGVGIVLTALIFIIGSFFLNETLTNSEVKKRAEAMGMIMPDSDTMENNEAESIDKKEADKNNESTKVETLTGDEVSKPPKETTDPTTQENEAEDSDGKRISFIVRKGETSGQVSANLYQKGLVENPTEFNTFLESNGYDKYINPGTYQIREGASDESIAKTLTGSN